MRGLVSRRRRKASARAPDGEDMMKPLASLSLIVMCIATPSLADQVVRATWYGNEHRGHRTAPGETLNPGGRTAAHKSLPFGTCLVVGNPKTGRKVAVQGTVHAGCHARSFIGSGASYWHAINTKRDNEPLLVLGHQSSQESRMASLPCSYLQSCLSRFPLVCEQSIAKIRRSHRCASLGRGRKINSPNPRRRSARRFHLSAIATRSDARILPANRCRLFDFW